LFASTRESLSAEFIVAMQNVRLVDNVAVMGPP